ncbi:Uncharacterised protein [Vibrio cholerae]|nr:Uncharacterised protein [Vibrio cholerae]
MLVGIDGGIQIRMRGHNDHRKFRGALVYLIEQSNAIHPWHANI